MKKSGLLQLHRGGERFADLGGLEALKDFCLRAMRRQGHRDPRKRPRGALLLGIPGSGKSAYSKALGAETGRPTLIMDVGALMGSLVGSTEANIRQALRIADAMAPCILMIDEVEKALSGVASGGSTDSGVSARLFGTFLTWLNDHESDVFTICTCNDISKLPPEFSRAERFDGIFFLGPSQRTAEAGDLQPVVKSLGALCKYIESGKGDKASVLRRAERLQRLLRSKLPREMPPLELFIITDG